MRAEVQGNIAAVEPADGLQLRRAVELEEHLVSEKGLQVSLIAIAGRHREDWSELLSLSWLYAPNKYRSDRLQFMSGFESGSWLARGKTRCVAECYSAHVQNAGEDV